MNPVDVGETGDTTGDGTADLAVRLPVISPKALKNDRRTADGIGMLFALSLLTVGYFAAVVWLRRTRRTAAAVAAGPASGGRELPVEDQPPPTAVGWPPAGTGFTSYVDEGFAALDAYLSEGFAA